MSRKRKSARPHPPSDSEPDLFSRLEDPPARKPAKSLAPEASSGTEATKKRPARRTAAERVRLSPEQLRQRMPTGAALAEVAVESAAHGSFTYLVDEALQAGLVPGARVQVPFGPRVTNGYYLGSRAVEDLAAEGLDPARLKFVRRRLDTSPGEGGASGPAPLLTAELLDLARWIARRYVCSLGGVLAAMLPAGVKRGAAPARVRMVQPAKPPEALRAAAGKRLARAPKQAALLRALSALGEPVPAPDLLAQAQAPESALQALRKQGWLRVSEQAAPTAPTAPGALSLSGASGHPASATPAPYDLTPAQRAALAEIERPLEAQRHQVFVLQGVTGSGKTEVYLRALQTTLRLGRQGIVLVPEIALTPQTAQRFEERLGGDRIAVLHSHLSGGERAEAWRAVRAGRVDIVVGARSALFAPLPRLGCIVLDEEHEGTFKQDSAPRYHARAVALERARAAGAVLVLGSATPSLESTHAAREGLFAHLRLPERVEGRALPPVEIVDLREENRATGRYTYLARALRHQLRETLERREQAILFLNRRGFATVITCLRCGHTERCAHCEITLTQHRARGVLCCHYCGFEKPVPEHCSDCGAPKPKFWGVGTERVEREVKRLFPEACVARMDSDTMRRRTAYLETLSAFRAGRIGVLVGTQMIAKGLDFPNVTLVGIVLADTALHRPDFRSRERTFQLLEQVAGRAGRGEKGGRVIVQTHLPHDPAIRFAAQHDFDGFADAELRERRTYGYPPYTRLARVLLRGKKQAKAEAAAREAGARLRGAAAGSAIRVLGPSAAPIAVLEGRHRYHLLLKAPDGEALAELFASPAGKALQKQKGAEVIVDMDPLAML